MNIARDLLLNTFLANISFIVFLPLLTGILLIILPERIKIFKRVFALVISIVTFICALQVYVVKSASARVNLFNLIPLRYLSLTEDFEAVTGLAVLNIDNLSRLIVLFVCLFSVIIIIYSFAYINKAKSIRNYYAYVMLTLACSVCAALADNLILFILFWGILCLTLYKLIKGYDEESSAAATKSLILIGASDGFIIFGMAVLWKIGQTMEISRLNIETNNFLNVFAFLSFLIGSFTKAGAFPFHTWIPDYTKKAPASSSAYLPASLDKLLGIYFMLRICRDMFVVNQWLTVILLITGVLTIIIGVMMALMQHNYKKLLGYHAVSQVGYMVIGLGLGTPLGIVGGLFHMINNALYKGGLFLVAGSIEKRTGKEDLDDLGGLSRAMPLTFITALVFSLSISGIPPFNGFASKWTIYQAIIDFGREPGIANRLWIVWLSLAVIGSALTLASFVKFITGAFLGRVRKEFNDVREVSIVMWLPQVFLTLVCIGFGVFATNLVIPKIFAPLAGEFQYTGSWDSSTISFLVLISIILGFLIYLAGNIKNMRTADSFIGGEKIQQETGYSSTEFYKTISSFNIFSFFYKSADRKRFDIYNVSKNIILWIYNKFGTAHSGVLSNYAIWFLVGLTIMLILLLSFI
jgi:formate hydrogenlyase subunit 3/multisubunit Na+/H+ antiporter MnhD subunit